MAPQYSLSLFLSGEAYITDHISLLRNLKHRHYPPACSTAAFIGLCHSREAKPSFYGATVITNSLSLHPMYIGTEFDSMNLREATQWTVPPSHSFLHLALHYLHFLALHIYSFGWDPKQPLEILIHDKSRFTLATQSKRHPHYFSSFSRQWR